MNRLFLLVILLICFVYVSQANPLPQDTAQSGSSDLDNLANKAKKMFNDAKGAFENTDINDTFEKAKSFIGQAGENIKKEIEKIAEKIRD